MYRPSKFSNGNKLLYLWVTRNNTAGVIEANRHFIVVHY